MLGRAEPGRAGRGAVANYVNGFAVQSLAYTTGFDVLGAAPAIQVPTLMVHSENALAPALARSFFAGLQTARDEVWVRSTGQIDFYDNPSIIAQAADRIEGWFKQHLERGR